LLAKIILQPTIATSIANKSARQAKITSPITRIRSMTLSDWYSLFQVSSVVLLFLTFAVGTGAVLTGIWLNKEQGRKLLLFEEQLTAAKTDLAKQQERAALAEARVNEAVANIEGARAETAKALAAQEKIRQDNLQLSIKLEEERLARLKLQKESEPRRLTGTQKDTLARLLADGSSAIAIVSKVLDTESSDFADDFDSALRLANWETLRIKNRLSSKYGVSLGTATGTPFTPLVKKLSDALTAIGVSHDTTTFAVGDASTSPPFQAGALYLVIEQKPPPSK
jgi:hypothetical protein